MNMKTELMRTTVRLLAILVIAASAGSFAHAQKATEQFIPIGKSPGLSGKFTVIGKIETVDRQKRTIICTDSTGSYTVKVNDGTRIWLDRTQQNQTAQTGALADCQQGRTVEVKFLDKNRKQGPAEWIKLR